MKKTRISSDIVFRLLIFSLIWITIDGVFRKWVFPELSTQIFALKYAFFSLTYALFFLKNTRFNKIKTSYQFLIVVLGSWCLFQFLNNPYHAPLLVLTFGVITYLFFIPLTTVVPHYITKLTQLENIIKTLAYISIPIYIIGIIQYYLPVDHPLNYLVNADQLTNKVGGFTRSLSIFTFVKIYDVYLLFTITLFIAYIYYLSFLGKTVWLYTLLIVFGILNLIMTGSRLQVFELGFNMLIISIFAYSQIKKLRKHVIFYFFSGIIVAVLLYNTTGTFKESTDAFAGRIEMTERVAKTGKQGYSAKDRVMDRVNIFIFAKQAGWTGLGMGTTYQGTGNFLKTVRHDFGYEEEGERIVLELGIIGGIIIFLLRLSILLYSIKVLFKIKSIQYALLTIPLVLYIFPPTFFLSNLTYNYYDGFSYWFAFSLILALEKSYTIHQLNLKTT
jgi:hypothetical protein